ncbi:type II toxin-antitoxin system HicA family toxin [Streptomyces angustmyceticus]|uniref:type II toxin-antitoxin system HicA family toxin n=1 Tax=Streptomyces angustmyceticus TaxID=285578 RepID=UPI0021AF3F5E|nr:type II toxin-antitoxin system HicA family toxin [Streptomyces angustmyceticus]
MKYRDLIKKIRDAAKARGVAFELVRQKGSHQTWVCGNTRVVIPKHTEINELTGQGICKTLEPELGEGWWR